MVGLILRTAAVLILCLVVADIVGVFVCTLFDISPFEGAGAALPYAIWPVLGIFCGISAFAMAGAWHSPEGDWMRRPEARRIATIILVTGAVLIRGLSLFFYRIYWSQGVAGEYYVPDSAPHSLVFFVSVLGAMAFCRYALTPKS